MEQLNDVHIISKNQVSSIEKTVERHTKVKGPNTNTCLSNFSAKIAIKIGMNVKI